MSKHVPDYLERAVTESDDMRAGVLLSLVEATEAQTEVMERIAEHLRRMAPPAPPETGPPAASVMRTALECCQAGDVHAAAHVLHTALSEAGDEVERG